MKVAYFIHKEDALRAGQDRHGRIVVEVSAASLTPAQREELAQWGREKDVDFEIGRWNFINGNRYYDPHPTEVSEAQAIKLIDESAAARAAHMAAREEERREEERRRAEGRKADLSKPAESWISKTMSLKVGGRWIVGWELGGLYRDDPDFAPVRAEAQRIAEERNAALIAEEEERQRVERENGEREEAERLAWIESHGSARLRRCVEEEIEHGAIYRSERLALERPGWEFYDQIPGTLDDARNPPAKAFELLDEARLCDPDATLEYLVTEDETGDEPDRRHVAVAEFLGRRIVYGAP